MSDRSPSRSPIDEPRDVISSLENDKIDLEWQKIDLECQVKKWKERAQRAWKISENWKEEAERRQADAEAAWKGLVQLNEKTASQENTILELKKKLAEAVMDEKGLFLLEEDSKDS